MSDRVDLRVVDGGGERPGLDLPQAIGPADWRQIGAGLAREQRAADIEWRIGDWAARADGTFATLDEAAAIVGESAGNLRKYVATARAYPPIRRRIGLAFHMHHAAAALPEAVRERLLDRALAEQWTRADMRAAAAEATDGGRLRKALRENAKLKRALRHARADARDVADHARGRLDGERRVIRDSLRRLTTVARDLAAEGALGGLHGNARRGLARDLRKLGNTLADDMDGAIEHLAAMAAIIEGGVAPQGARNQGAPHRAQNRIAVERDQQSAWECATDAQRDQARARLAAVRHAEALIAIGISSGEANRAAAAKAGVSRGAVSRWRSKVRGLPEGARVAALLDGMPTGRPPKIAGEVREILEALDSHNPAHLTAKHCHRTLIARLGHAPSQSTISHWLTARRRDCAYERSAVADPDRHRSHRKPAGGDAAAHIARLNQEWELDSTPADVICADGLRYAVVVAIDIWSRRTRGLVAPTSRAAAIAALLRRCILDWGVPETVRTDEGADYTSRHVVGAIADLEIEHDICLPFAPDAKPFVERVIKTIGHDLFANLPGFTGHNVAQAQALRARKSFAARQGEDKCEAFRVALSAEELQACLDTWCDDLYGREPHAGLGGLSPFERVTAWTGSVRRIGDARALDALLAAPADDGWRTVRKGGIRLGNVDYIAGPLGGIVGERVHVRRDPGDLDRIFVYLPAPSGPERPGEFVCVAQDPARTGADRAAIAGAMTRAYTERSRKARARARDLVRRHKPEQAMADVLAHAAEGAERVVALPRKSETHETPALRQAARAAEAADAADTRDRSGAGDPHEGAATHLPKRRTALAAAMQLYTEEF